MFDNMKIILADDHPLFRQALTITLKSHFTSAVIVDAQNIPELELHLQSEEKADLLLLDLDIPGAHGFNSLISIRRSHPDLGIVVISGFEDKETIHKAMSFGAAGFIPKSTPVPQMLVAIKEVLNGTLWTPDGEFNPNEKVNNIDDKIASLTPKQHEILLMFADGLLNKQIASQLGTSESTIKSHASIIFLKLGVRNRTQAVITLNELQLNQSTFGQ
ncbi:MULTISPECIES: response regulator transcription factor [Colwellia]|uniref:DNA-binding response regulator, LuxR family n=1 Tax=Colwellia psychrerythraea (strain 34H / ATCC BAA-681) TaxID=167879 RepID=Q47YM5_COLP3|nr:MULTISPECIES: response regulator transcription factor [Colwellia]AAZ25291.1 DNA-binding response regulator, LuxR family [Colwellia psychrerythraea 34H]PKH86955.1 DNA-binding response regulator [Colwellia sp. Bg11-28]